MLKKCLIAIMLTIAIILVAPMAIPVENIGYTVEAASVKINKKSCTVYVGESYTLKISGTNKKVKWSSSDKKIATVNSKGKVTAKKKGKVTITAKVSGKKYKCEVKVKDLSLNKTSCTIGKGETYTLKVNKTTKKIKWTSSNKSVATVDSKGKVTAKKNGTTTVTAKVNGKKYKCQVKVKSIALDKTKLNLEVGKKYTLKLQNTRKSIKWTSSNKSVATVNSKGKVTAKREGTATITAKIGNKSYKCKVKVKPLDMTKKVGAPDYQPSNYLVFSNFGFSVNSVNGIQMLWLGKNNTGKTINYYTIRLYFYNPVGDPAYDEITHRSYVDIRVVGPVEPGEDLIIYKNIGYVPACSKIIVGDMKLEYSDGTQDTGWYGYYTTNKYYE